MARRVFFSFHFERDVFRVNQIRNSWVTRGNQQAAGVIDGAEFESLKRKGKGAVEQWIRQQLQGCSVTVVLIGKQTCERDYVLYEIEQSYQQGKGLLGIRIHGMKDISGDSAFFGGGNPFAEFETGEEAFLIRSTLADSVQIYDWIDDDGYDNMASWVEQAARDAGR